MKKEVKLYDKDACFTCTHRHHQNPSTCKVEPCRYRKQSEPLTKLVVCAICGCSIAICKCKKPKLVNKYV